MTSWYNRLAESVAVVLSKFTGWFKIKFATSFDFSKKLSHAEKARNVLTVLAVSAAWVILMALFVMEAFGLSLGQLESAIKANVTLNLSAQWVDKESLLLIFFLACVLAPLWEESIFRYMAIRVSQSWDAISWGKSALLPMCFASSIIFGILHGSVLNILFQGFTGLSLCWLYLKNNNSYWSVVIAHALWNFLVVFGGDWIFK